MICPNCGVNSETFEQEKAARRRRMEELARKEAEFEGLYGEKIRRLRRRSSLVWVLIYVLSLGGIVLLIP